MSTVIKVENLSKQYRLGNVGTGSLAHDLNRSWHRVRGKEDPYLKIGEENDRTVKGTSEYVWALRDINFDVQQGEVLGIIGRNGAGKSTLLKILSRTTSPTTGTVKIKGRIASLLEVGTGFHPELSGRENIFLNGAILGMTKQEIKSKFDEIVDFSGVERYIDTPVKRYSSGMYVRLAFGVAAHLESEILIVDEVLAVGDSEFQKKCLGKMREVSTGEGKTVLFVSHSMAAIQNLCKTGLLLNNGHLICSNSIEYIVASYLKSNASEQAILLTDRIDRSGNGNFLFTSVTLQNEQEETVDMMQSGGYFKLNLHFKSNVDVISELMVAVGINNHLGERIAHMNNEITNQLFKNITVPNGVVKIFLPKLPLKQGRYGITIYSSIEGEIADWIQDAVFIDVEQGDFYNTGNLLPENQGNFLLDYKFSISNTGGEL